MSIRPTLDETRAFVAAGATLVPISRELVADGLTPVAALALLGKGPGSYLLESAPGGEAWSRYSFVGFSPDAIVHARSPDSWSRLRAMLAENVPHLPWLPRFSGGAVGYITYAAAHRFEPKSLSPNRAKRVPSLSLPEFSFALGGPLLAFDAKKQTVRVIVPARFPPGSNVATAYDAAVARIQEIEKRLNAPNSLLPLPIPEPTSLSLPPSSFSREEFLRAVAIAKEHIAAGDIFQVVLSQRFGIEAAGRDAFDVYRCLRLLNPSPYMYFLRFPEIRIAGASPETLVRLTDGVAEVRPIAGTRRRGVDDADDARLEAELLADPKERAEHVMLVDLARNDLGRIGAIGSVQLEERMIVERYSHVMHIVSHVRAQLADGKDALDVLRATFPAGTLSGAPKIRAMQIIDELEPVDRGLYGGAVGYLGWDGNMDLAIAIRTVTEQAGTFTVQAGAGIVDASDAAAEWNETLAKARASLLAIESAPKR